ncbi:hypothetical protein ORJ00_08915 [Rheinheimera baltica]|uniref:hypothetical protein n=1 Tax=Rheinheimera baltica TaxID=67576 RepID=UPI00273E0793|nr:hypothetical protein [Rheinheimera baltica]MDP5142860.1 hypothetical protein [Rheinheimera baltica]
MNDVNDEDYFVAISLTDETSTIENIPCKIFLPKNRQEPVKLIATTDDPGISKALRKQKLSKLNTKVVGLDSRCEADIFADKVMIRNLRTRFWGPGKLVTQAELYYKNLYVKGYAPECDHQVENNFTFWLSPNFVLKPHNFECPKRDGSIEVEFSNPIQYELSKFGTVLFSQAFRFERKEEQLVRHACLTANLVMDKGRVFTADLAGELLSELEDFLLIASLVSNERTLCFGWSYEDNRGVTDLYRGNMPIVARNPYSYEKSIIDRMLANEFISNTYSVFVKFNNRQHIRDAIYALVPIKKPTLELEFLAYFSAFEAILLEYKRANDAELVLDEGQFKSFRKYLENCIKNSDNPVPLNKGQRKLLYDKLGELNRVSLQESWISFRNFHQLDISDLWPVFSDDGQGLTLSEIRNRLIHGDTVGIDFIDALSIATIHLRFVLCRCLLVSLGWDVVNSKTSKEYLRLNFGRILDVSAIRIKHK